MSRMTTLIDMIKNKVPVKEIVDYYKTNLDISHYYMISKYCTRSEYDKYCHKFGDLVRLENPHMTVEWYVSCVNITYIDWYTCAIVRDDLFTPDVVMQYHHLINESDGVWHLYYTQFPFEFIEKNMNNMYCNNFYNCIETLRKHPSGVSWEFIDKYISMHSDFYNWSRTSLSIPLDVHDLPLWFVKKYINGIYLKALHLNDKVTYNFVLKHLYEFGNRIPESELAKMREKHNYEIKRAFSICGNIDADLLTIIANYF